MDQSFVKQMHKSQCGLRRLADLDKGGIGMGRGDYNGIKWLKNVGLVKRGRRIGGLGSGNDRRMDGGFNWLDWGIGERIKEEEKQKDGEKVDCPVLSEQMDK
jgi:hypothetical protein